VPHYQWEDWIKGNPSKLVRYWKFLAKGFSPMDKITRDFIITQANQLFGSGSLQRKYLKQHMTLGIIQGATGSEREKRIRDFQKVLEDDLGKTFFVQKFGTSFD